MKLVVPSTNQGQRPKPVHPPTIDPEFTKLNCLQRAAESFRYVVLRWEHWISPDGSCREWLRRNTHLGVWLLIPAGLVMPVIGLILWQLTGWLSLLTTIFGRLILLPALVLLALVSISIALRVITAVIKR